MGALIIMYPTVLKMSPKHTPDQRFLQGQRAKSDVTLAMRAWCDYTATLAGAHAPLLLHFDLKIMKHYVII